MHMKIDFDRVALFWLLVGIAVCDFALMIGLVLAYGVKPSAYGLAIAGSVAVVLAFRFRKSPW
jgi:hypothetical protein